MNRNRTAMIVAGAALLAWLAGAATSNHAIPASAVVEPRVIESRGAELADEIARLHERLRPVATPRRPARNLFAYRAAPATAPAAPAPTPALTAAPAPVPLSLPALKLAGIAEDNGADGPERTAFISGEGQLFMVKEGETVTQRYRVTKISADVVELIDLTDDTLRRLALR
ncbi:MAG: hypothetical protein DMF95_09540 [Acidobacteria bacterium]|nr:MAG: hypothetical protein DMF95_09540 [Acidobacteriota bacterium]